MTRIFVNGKVIFPGEIREGLAVVCTDGVITDILPAAQLGENVETIDVGGNYLSPGFVDIHVHGGGGYGFMDGTPEAIDGAARFHLAHGTTSIIPTTLTSSDEDLYMVFDAFRQVKSTSPAYSLLGLHLEGPFLNPVKCGGQDPNYLSVPDLKRASEILAHSSDIVRWSIAPELEGALDLGKMLSNKGIVCSVAHTAASFDQVEAAMFAGFSLMTHFYSAMSACFKVGCYRVAGAVEAGYLLDGLSVEMIADGKHLPKEILRMVWKFKGADRAALCTDALSTAGLPEGTIFYNGRPPHGAKSIIDDGVGKLLDYSALAGSMATSDRLVRVMYKEALVPLPDAVEMMSLSPAKMVKAHHKGSIRIGKDADFVVFDDNINVKAVYTAGELYTGGFTLKPVTL
ncbi:MAG: N-acetylglucosamine-6-phosphate deacetylase [Bacteroidales bacterium]|nr:N-acetylglucosamine-6-phosphate deacetylase [Bacteroidales bacterium]